MVIAKKPRHRRGNENKDSELTDCISVREYPLIKRHYEIETKLRHINLELSNLYRMGAFYLFARMTDDTCRKEYEELIKKQQQRLLFIKRREQLELIKKHSHKQCSSDNTLEES